MTKTGAVIGRSSSFLQFLILIAISSATAQEPQIWEIKESLGHGWTNELVFFPVKDTNAVLGYESRYSVTDEMSQSLPFQFYRQTPSTGKAAWRLALLVDLAPYGSRRFTLSAEPKTAQSHSYANVWSNNGTSLVLAAGRMAVRVAVPAGFKPGMPFDKLPAPIQAVKGLSGRWLGEGSLQGSWPVRAFSVTVDADGPLFAQATLRYEFDERKFYQVRVRVVAGEDVVLVEEDFALSSDELKETIFVTPPDLAPEPGTPSALSNWLVRGGMGWMDVTTAATNYPCFRFNFFKNWEAERVTKYDLGGGTVLTRPGLPAGTGDWRQGMLLTPYQGRGNRVVAVGFDAPGKSADYLGFFSRYLSRWQHAVENQVPLPWLDEGVVGQFIAFEGHREWGLMVGDSGAGAEEKSKKHGGSVFSPIRGAQVKHGETPLDKVKDWTLEWNLPADMEFPRIYYTPASIAQMKRDYVGLPANIKSIIHSDQPAEALLTGNDAGLKKAFGQLGELRNSAITFLTGGHNTTDTYTHRFQEIVRHSATLVDISLASNSITVEERRRALAVVAFLAYKISDSDYWAYHSYGGGPSNPNMMSIATDALAKCAALCAGHPRQKEWFELCRRLVCADILMSINPSGAWLESPGYQGAGNTPINMTVLILKNAGIIDLVKDPLYGQRLMAVSTYYANLLTPPDPRFAGKRMPMALGDNVPFFNNMYTYLAFSGRETFPVQAGNAAWCWEKMGRPSRDALLLMNEHVLDGSIKPAPITGTSVAVPGFGVMFRHGFGTSNETFMTYRQSNFAYGHYDEDQGSFSLFAKGAPLCLDWIDYSPNEAEYHNRVNYHPAALPWLTAPPDVFVTHAEADYVRTHETGLSPSCRDKSMPPAANTDWQRQILFVKDNQNPDAATYFVFRDVVPATHSSEWNVWTLAKPGTEKIADQTAWLEGQFGVDVALTFYRKPPASLTSLFHHHRTHSYIQMNQDQTRIQARAEIGGDYGVVLFPLRHGAEAPPVVNELASGTVEIRWATGRRHLIFLFPEVREVTQDGVTFKGRSGLVKFENGKTTIVPLECARMTP
ncbi:MAG: hypothetical protein WCH84_00110 [Verrucomicrobiota bacterium]